MLIVMRPGVSEGAGEMRPGEIVLGQAPRSDRPIAAGDLLRRRAARRALLHEHRQLLVRQGLLGKPRRREDQGGKNNQTKHGSSLPFQPRNQSFRRTPCTHSNASSPWCLSSASATLASASFAL